jgi:hypothetical protein
VVSTATHVDTATTLSAAAARDMSTGEAGGHSTLPGWGWEWQQDLDPGLIASPTFLR